MTEWILECKVCGTQRILDVGYNLREFKELYIYCKACGRNTPHRIVGVRDEHSTSRP